MSETKVSWMKRFWAVVRYEMLWNIRKKMFIGALIFAFIFATLNIALPAALGVSENPYFTVTFSVGSFVFVLFAIVTGAYCISGEYEKGTIIPLLTKPVSRTMVFLGKLFAIFIVILATYGVIYTYTIIGGLLVYGPQNSLHLVPLALLGDILSTFIWVGVVIVAGTISKNSLLAILTTLGLFVALLFGTSIVGQLSDNPGPLNYIPGSGASGTMNVMTGQNITISTVTINTFAATTTGTDSIGVNLIKATLYPDANVNFYYTDIQNLINPNSTEPPRLLYSESITLIAVRSAVFALLYTEILFVAALFVFKRWEISE
ncbi:MAG: ABC transporter permease subunit [Crenarchaeota archaeon]|jgi:ABC-type transport system involved in multi-copper enzyme maturation permease subunit|nr:ABC transporter permease subunit [Thermoproteota archaeon]